MAQLTEKQAQFLDNPYVGIVTTLRDDGSPHSTVVWVEQRDGEISFNTARGRAKDSHLQRDPRVSLLMVDPQNQYHWVAVAGRAEMSEEDGDEWIDRLAKKYLDADSYPFRNAAETRVTIRITPEHVDSTGFDS